jgi:serine/threonine protein phosphatase PrpC
MSRSFGDRVAHSVGVSAEAETMEFTLGLNDKFVVIASDGVWEFLSNEDVANIVLPFYE